MHRSSSDSLAERLKYRRLKKMSIKTLGFLSILICGTFAFPSSNQGSRMPSPESIAKAKEILDKTPIIDG